jgi:hypothetical protein
MLKQWEGGLRAACGVLDPGTDVGKPALAVLRFTKKARCSPHRARHGECRVWLTNNSCVSRRIVDLVSQRSKRPQ